MPTRLARSVLLAQLLTASCGGVAAPAQVDPAPMPGPPGSSSADPPPNASDETKPLQPGSLCVGQNLCKSPNRCQPVGLSGASATGQYCTQDCADSPEVCGAGTACAAVGNARLCLSTCPVEQTSHCPAKAVCKAEATTGVQLCFPQCENDADCSAGACDTFSGLCSPKQPGGGTVGTFCASDADCDGRCVAVAQDLKQCTKACVYGSYATCGSDVCVPLGDGFDLYSQGLCRKACACDRDCGSALLVCDPFTGLAPVQVLNLSVKGICRPLGDETTGLACEQ